MHFSIHFGSLALAAQTELSFVAVYDLFRCKRGAT